MTGNQRTRSTAGIFDAPISNQTARLSSFEFTFSSWRVGPPIPSAWPCSVGKFQAQTNAKWLHSFSSPILAGVRCGSPFSIFRALGTLATRRRAWLGLPVRPSNFRRKPQPWSDLHVAVERY
ncbi:hypothetical protein THAOC_13302 [Thalassiosira oceanica]|uniref:Uncharacterized protein n=1 Tax=Thalassiosira oceanica TaxID=159749 RepID=K0SXQ8_THAOC|nr:hypothetical protein THAOC_13302 [Thalassiosira oceanica]|eukprot:EJK65801.1 hypothetical protein THAOC_13302 [Thalassiosira oceanica]